MWRIRYIADTVLGLARRKPVDLGVFCFFMLPGRARAMVFGNNFLVKRFLRRFGLGAITYEGRRVKLIVEDLVFFLPVRGFAEGDFFDILVPYIAEKNSASRHAIHAYTKTNLERFFDGPYLDGSLTLEEDDVVIDAGASAGLFSVVASRLAGSRGRVLAFEPIAEAAVFFEENIGQNGCRNVALYPMALGEANGEVEFNVNIGEHFEGASKYLERGGERRKVTQITLDAFVEKNGVSRVDCIKADVEGAERDLVAGAAETIKRFRPRIAIRTYHRPDDPEVLANMIREYAPDYEIRHVNRKTLYAKAPRTN